MKKIIAITAFLLMLISVFSGTVYAVNDGGEGLRERETDSSFVDSYQYPLPQQGEISQIPLERLEELEKEIFGNGEDGAYIPPHWSQAGVTVDSAKYPVTVDVTRKIAKAVTECEASPELETSCPIFSVDTTGKIITDDKFVMDQTLAEKIATVYRDQVDDENLKDVNILTWSRYVEEDSVWLVFFMNIDITQSRESVNGYVTLGGGKGMTVAVRDDGTVARIYQ